MKNFLALMSICLFFFGCAQDDCECELPEPEDDFYFKFEVNGTQHLYEDERNIAYNMFDEDGAIYSLNCKGFEDSGKGTGRRISLTLFNNEPIQVRNIYDLQDFYQAPSGFLPRVIIRYVDASGEPWKAREAVVHIENFTFQEGFVKESFDASMVDAYIGNKSLQIQNGEFRLPLVFSL